VDWSVVIPVKRMGLAKTRLRGGLPGVPHHDLVLSLAADTVAAAVACRTVAAVLVVTDEPVVRRTVNRLGAEAVADLPDAGLNPALAFGADQATRRHPGAGVAALGADLPALRPEELADALFAAAAHPRAYVCDQERTGTVLLTVRPGSRLDPRFGLGSARTHRDSGAVELDGEWPSLRRDVDTAGDLATAIALGVGPRTAATLRRPAGDVRAAGSAGDGRSAAGIGGGTGAKVGAVQATVATYDPGTRTGTALLDDGREVAFDATAFDASPLRYLRLGQRIALQHDESGRIVRISLPTLP
jgi:2-phospho-L-lactate guanylyltransferase